jgi:hypothetical protein
LIEAVEVTAGVDGWWYLSGIRAATSAWVNPARRRARNNSSSKANSSSCASCSALTAGRFNIFLTISSCVSIVLNLLESGSCDLQFFVRGFRRFLDKGVEHHDLPLWQRAVENAPDALLGLLVPAWQVGSRKNARVGQL